MCRVRILILLLSLSIASVAAADMGLQLIDAATRGDIDTVKALLNKGANINTKDKEGKTALIWAAMNGHPVTVKLLLNRGAEINIKDKTNKTALIWAATNDYPATVQVLLDRGALVNNKDKEGKTALIWAARYGHLAVAQVLVENGADLTVQDNTGDTALILAKRRGNSHTARFLLDAQNKITGEKTPTDIDKIKKDRPLPTPPDKSEVTNLVSEKTDKTVQKEITEEDFVEQPLAEEGPEVVVEQKEAPVDQEKPYDLEKELDQVKVTKTPSAIPIKKEVSLLNKLKNYFSFYKWKGYAITIVIASLIMIIALLLIRSSHKIESKPRCNVDISTKDKEGLTPLMYAAMSGHTDIVRILLAEGADVNERSKSGKTALLLAVMGGHNDTVKMLLKNGAKGKIKRESIKQNDHSNIIEISKKA